MESPSNHSSACLPPINPSAPPFENPFHQNGCPCNQHHLQQQQQQQLLQDPSVATHPSLYPKITKEFKELKDFMFWNALQNKRKYLEKGNECKGELNEVPLENMDPAAVIANMTVPNRVVWTQPQPLQDPAAQGVVHNHYYGPVINKNEHRECINCCEDCCEDTCENCCLDCSRLTDLSSLVIGSLLGQKDQTAAYSMLQQNEQEQTKKRSTC